MAVLNIIHGFIGAGKTTFSKKMAEQTGAVHICGDEWMAILYGRDMNKELFDANFKRMQNLYWLVVKDFLNHRVDVVLDAGFWSRYSRDYARQVAKECQAECKIYWLDVPYNVMKQRTLDRSKNPSHQDLIIDENDFDSLYKRFEPLMPDESFEHIRV